MIVKTWFDDEHDTELYVDIKSARIRREGTRVGVVMDGQLATLVLRFLSENELEELCDRLDGLLGTLRRDRADR